MCSLCQLLSLLDFVQSFLRVNETFGSLLIAWNAVPAAKQHLFVVQTFHSYCAPLKNLKSETYFYH